MVPSSRMYSPPTPFLVAGQQSAARTPRINNLIATCILPSSWRRELSLVHLCWLSSHTPLLFPLPLLLFLLLVFFFWQGFGHFYMGAKFTTSRHRTCSDACFVADIAYGFLQRECTTKRRCIASQRRCFAMRTALPKSLGLVPSKALNCEIHIVGCKSTSHRRLAFRLALHDLANLAWEGPNGGHFFVASK